MSIIPLDLQRRCEQRWAARFSRPVKPVAKQGPEKESQQIAVSGEGKRKAHRIKSAGLRAASAV